MGVEGSLGRRTWYLLLKRGVWDTCSLHHVGQVGSCFLGLDLSSCCLPRSVPGDKTVESPLLF